MEVAVSRPAAVKPLRWPSLRIWTGTISVDGGNWYAAASPFGGYKASGIGPQGGLEGFEQHFEAMIIGRT